VLEAVLEAMLEAVLEGVSVAVPVLHLSVVQHFIHDLVEPDVAHVLTQYDAHA
jgi:hypothetical protein